jgi:hypothetical protein
MEAKLKEIVERLKLAAGENLQAVALYGSAVTGEFIAKHSDLNIICILQRAGAADLEALHSAAEWWIREGHSAPLVFTFEELQRSADVFAIELFDMKNRHRILYGEDFLAPLEVPLNLHRLQVERELRTNWVRLRQAILVAPLRNKAHGAIMLASVSSFCTLFRHALAALGQPMPATKREAVDAMAAFTGGNPTAFHAILDLREGKKKERQLDIEASLHAYLEFVEVVTNEVDRRFNTQ